MTKKQSDDTAIAVINTNVAYVQKDISEIKADIKIPGNPEQVAFNKFLSVKVTTPVNN